MIARHYLTFIILLALVIPAKASELRVVSTPHKLLQYKENNELKGPSSALYTWLMKEASLSSEVEFMPWARAFQIAKSTPNSLIFSIVRNQEREHDFHWILPVSQLIQTFIGKSAETSKAQYSLKRIKSRLTVVLRNTYGHSLLLEQGFTEGENLYVVSSLEVALRLYFENKVEFIFTEPNVIRSRMKEYGLTESDLVMGPILGKAIKKSYIAANKGLQLDILEKLKKAASKIQKSQEFQRLFYLVEH